LYLDVERDLIRIAQFAGTNIDTYQGLEGSGMSGGASKKPKLIIEEDEDEDEDEEIATPVKKPRGRPKGTKNKPASSTKGSFASSPVSMFPSSAFVVR
jgi:hypothetical protein